MLDTHAFLWFINDDKQLSAKAKNVINDVNTIKYLSIVSLWEIAIKLRIGKLDLDVPFKKLEQQIKKNGFEMLPISFEHTCEVCSLDLHHGDPFDRMIIAQALVDNYIVISRDKNFTKYNNLQLLW